MVREPADYDTGFVCKTCGRFYADKDVKQWSTKWTAPAEGSERTLVEIVHQCPLCGATCSHAPNEGTLRGLWQGKR